MTINRTMLIILALSLALSLALNLALVGFVAGRASSSELRPPVPSMMAVGRVVHELPEDRREALRPLLRSYYRELRPELRGMAEAQAGVREALLTEPFDAAGARSALERFNTRLCATQSGNHEALIALIKALTPAERQSLVENLHRRPRRGPGVRPGNPPPGPPQ